MVPKFFPSKIDTNEKVDIDVPRAAKSAGIYRKLLDTIAFAMAINICNPIRSNPKIEKCDNQCPEGVEGAESVFAGGGWLRGEGDDDIALDTGATDDILGGPHIEGNIIITDRKSTRLNSSHASKSRMPSSA